MNTATKPLQELIQALPPVLRAEVRDFVEFLLAKHDRPMQPRLRQDWAEALKDDPAQPSAVDLQHRALDRCSTNYDALEIRH